MAKVTLATFSSEVEAHLALSRLALDHIPATINRFSRYRAMGSGGYQLKVEPAQAAAARRILNSIDREIDMDEYVDTDDTSYTRCPKCNSVNVDKTPLPAKTVLLSLFLLGVPMLFMGRDYVCRKCGHGWRR